MAYLLKTESYVPAIEVGIFDHEHTTVVPIYKRNSINILKSNSRSCYYHSFYILVLPFDQYIEIKLKIIQDVVAITIHFIFLYRKQENKMMSSDKQLCVPLFDLDIMHEILTNLQFILK